MSSRLVARMSIPLSKHILAKLYGAVRRQAFRPVTASSLARQGSHAEWRANRRKVSACVRAKYAGFGVLALALFLVLPAHARNPDPPQRLPLTPLGFQTISERYLLRGATMVTVDFVDNTHLLVTFGISRLMPRLPDCPTEDEDRTVKAVLLELPSGKELASTEWRFHDLGQYLWDLGDGHFMLRNRDTLTTFAPLENLTGKPFQQAPFLHFTRRIEAVIVSADHDLLAIETTKIKALSAAEPMLQMAAQPSPPATPDPAPQPRGLLRRDPTAAAHDSAPVEVNFLRLLHNKTEAPSSDSAHHINRVAAQLLAHLRTEKVVIIPLTTAGFLETRSESKAGVLFHFITYTGKDLDLGDFPTSCHPRPTFISHSEFVTYGCRGADDSLDLAGFNLRGDLIWQINFTDQQAYPSFASAPASGRFAFSRTITTSNVFGSETPSASQLTAQEIRVIQMYNGKQLVRAVASPIQRAGQNYALSPDGLTLAVIHDTPAPPVGHGEKPLHDTAVELFKLPALSPKDIAEIKTEAALAPPTADVPMRFSMKEIKEALNTRSGSDADAEIAGDATATSSAKTQSPADRSSNGQDGKIVGDPPAANPVAQSSTVNVESHAAAPSQIPTADTAPACANLTDASVAACPVSSAPKATPAKTDSNAPPEPERRRKPPTLYEPVPTTDTKGPQP